MQEQEPIKIVIQDENEEATFVPEPRGNRIKEQAGKLGKQAARGAGNAAKKVWQSDVRKKATAGVARGVGKVAAKGGEVVHRAVVKTAEKQARERVEATKTRIKETDWKAEAQTGTVKGLRWLSQKIGDLAERLTKEKEPQQTGQ